MPLTQKPLLLLYWEKNSKLVDEAKSQMVSANIPYLDPYHPTGKENTIPAKMAALLAQNPIVIVFCSSDYLANFPIPEKHSSRDKNNLHVMGEVATFEKLHASAFVVIVDSCFWEYTFRTDQIVHDPEKLLTDLNANNRKKFWKEFLTNYR